MDRRAKVLLILAGLGVLYLATSSTMTLIKKIAKLIHGEEGERLDVYPDIGGKWTVGKGHLILSTDRVVRNGVAVPLYPYGPPVDGQPSGVKTITQAESDAFFERDTAIARNAVSELVNVPLTDNQRAALVSLVFNIGRGAFAQSTLLRLLNAGRNGDAANQFLVWKKVNGVDSPALLARRQRERIIFLT